MDPLSQAPWPARALLGAAGLAAALALALAVGSGASPAIWIGIAAAIGYLGVGLLGLLLAARDRRNATGWVLLAGSVGAALLPLIDLLIPRAVGFAVVPLTLLRALAAVALSGLFTLGVLIFPEGRGYGWLGRILVPIAAVALALLAIGAMLDLPASWEGSPGAGTFPTLSWVLILAGFAVVLPLSVLAAVTVTQRRRAAHGDARRGLRLFECVAWLNAVALLGCGALSLLANLPDWFGAVADQTGVVFAVAAWIGIVRYRLLDLRLVLARTLPYLAASLLVVGVAALVASLLGTITAGWLGTGVGVVIAALTALVLRDRLQMLANLLVYGRRTDPATERARRLEQALQESHRLLVTARDDERRRIRRDLHDGLGPTLAGIVLGVEGVARHLDDPERAYADLGRLREESRDAVAEVRRIVYALRPPVLDSLGLDGAIREQADRLGAASVEVSALPELPDSIEIGVYLIALEAMKNAATHGRPGDFWVRLAATDGLALEVHDDGPGLPTNYVPGVGIQSMRERAAELGGTFDLIARQPSGTLVRAEWMLPV